MFRQGDGPRPRKQWVRAGRWGHAGPTRRASAPARGLSRQQWWGYGGRLGGRAGQTCKSRPGARSSGGRPGHAGLHGGYLKMLGWAFLARKLVAEVCPGSRPALGPDSPFPKPTQSSSPRRTACHQPTPQPCRVSSCAGHWPRWNGCSGRCGPVTWGFREPPLRLSWGRPRDVSGVGPSRAETGGVRTRLGALGLRSAWSGIPSAWEGGRGLAGTRSHCPSDRSCTGPWPVLAHVQEQLTRHWERNQALVARIRDQLAQHEAGLMDLREALNRAVGTTREAEELNSRNQERLEEALVGSLPRGPPAPPPPLPQPPLTHTHRPLPCHPTPSFSCLILVLSRLPHSPSSPATETGAVPGQCHSGGHSAGRQRHPGPAH